MDKKFQYEPRDVIPDIRSYLQSFVGNDTYGTTTKDCLHLVGELMHSVETALYDAGMRNELLGGVLPDRIRILLDGVGLLSAEEIKRRYDMLKLMYDNFVDSESATEYRFAGSNTRAQDSDWQDDVY